MDLDLICEKCGAILSASFNGRHEVEIELCSDCEEAIKVEEYKKGYDDGYEEGNKE